MKEIISQQLKVPKDAQILDLGCGPGIIGEMLGQSSLGYSNIDGVDATPNYVQTAKASGNYRETGVCWVGNGLEKFPWNDCKGKYELVVGCGVYYEGHFPKEAFDDHVEATKPGGHILFGVRELYWESGEKNGFYDKIHDLIKAGKLQEEPAVSMTYERGIPEL